MGTLMGIILDHRNLLAVSSCCGGGGGGGSTGFSLLQENIEITR
jgi:hypothetical protein